MKYRPNNCMRCGGTLPKAQYGQYIPPMFAENLAMMQFPKTFKAHQAAQSITHKGNIGDTPVDNSYGQQVGNYVNGQYVALPPAAPKMGWDPTNLRAGMGFGSAALSEIAGRMERGRQDDYWARQQSTLGQMNPMPATDYQPNPYSLYAKYGGQLRKMQGGGQTPKEEYVNLKGPDGAVRVVSRNSPEFKQLEASGVGYTNTETGEFVAEKTLPEVVIRNYKYEGCVNGMCHDMADSNNLGYEEFRKMNNAYGNAWNFQNNAFDAPVWDAGSGQAMDFSKLRVNDVVNMSRKELKGDKEKGIPGANQHIGRVSKIVDGVPWVKHYVGNRYYEEPINDVKDAFAYTPSKVYRLDGFKEINPARPNFRFNPRYDSNGVEQQVLQSMNKDAGKLQQALKLTDQEYMQLAPIAYGILGNESSFGRSARTAYRMGVPDFMQKAVKVADDFVHGRDVYDGNLNNLSQGYGSNKESSQFNIDENDRTGRGYNAMHRDIRGGNLSNYNRNTNYTYHAFNKLGLNPDNLESGENSYKAVMAQLAQYKKQNPGASLQDLAQKYTGKSGKSLQAYVAKMEKQLQVFTDKFDEKNNPTVSDNLWGALSQGANKVNAATKKVRNNLLGAVRDVSPLPDNLDQMLYDAAGGDKPFTAESMDAGNLEELKNIVRRNVANGKMTISYDDYQTGKNKNEDVNGNNVGLSKMVAPKYQLKTLLGQAGIRHLGGNRYEVVDQYNFNDAGKSFGFLDDVRKRGTSTYAIPRSFSRNFNSRDGSGSPVKIVIDLDK